MKKNILVFISLVLINFISAQGLTKNGSVVTDVVVNSLKVGATTYPNNSGTAGQVLTANYNGIASWTNLPSNIPTVKNGNSEQLTELDSGKTIYLTEPIFNYWFFGYLPSGFTCTFINWNSASIPIEGNGNVVFYSKYAPQGAGAFAIEGGGTVKLNVIIAEGEMRYYVTGDVIQPY